MLLGVFTSGDGRLAGFVFHFFKGFAQQMTGMLEGILSIAFECLKGLLGLFRGVVFEAFRDLSRLSISASMLCNEALRKELLAIRALLH